MAATPDDIFRLVAATCVLLWTVGMPCNIVLLCSTARYNTIPFGEVLSFTKENSF